MSTYSKPRRCGKRWLDGDCPPEVLCIIDAGPSDPAPERYDVIYAEVQKVTYGYGEEVGTYTQYWLSGFSLSEYGGGSHFELETHQVASYRYRMRHKYTKWSTLPEAVKTAVRRDLEEENP